MGSLWPRAARRAGPRLVRVWVDEPHGVAIVELHDPKLAATKLEPLTGSFTPALLLSSVHALPLPSPL
eukprot:scaffold65911_cov45-Phaeocystis_antarctica.AAC.1